MEQQHHGLVAEFRSNGPGPRGQLGASRFRKMDAYSPSPSRLATLSAEGQRLPWIVLGGGLTARWRVGLEYWSSVIAYPLNIGGRPLHSMPSFIVPAYETTILLAALGAVVGMIVLNGLPMPYHPVFNVPAFEAASSDRFFLTIETADPKFDVQATRGGSRASGRGGERRER
jgi:hypothetical protein